MKKEHEESRSGFHYWNLYQRCPRRWYIRYIMGLRAKTTPYPLIFGSAIHESIAGWWLGKNMVNVFLDYMSSHKDEYDSNTQLEDDTHRGVVLLENYMAHYTQDHYMYELLDLEVEVEAQLMDGTTITCRFDRVVRERTAHVTVIMETKTTGWSVSKALRALDNQDQATTYLLAARKAYDKKIDFIQPDILYQRQSKVQFARLSPVYRDKEELLRFEKNVIGVRREINQKVAALDGGYEPEMLFPRNGWDCSNLSCEYEPICRTNVTGKETGYVQKRDSTGSN